MNRRARWAVPAVVGIVVGGSALGPVRLASAVGLAPTAGPVSFVPEATPVRVVSPAVQITDLTSILENQAIPLAGGGTSPAGTALTGGTLLLRFDRIDLASLSINYRTPEEVMAEAEPVIRAVLPDANVPVSIRSTGVPVVHGPASELGEILSTWLAAHAEGIACVIGDPAFLKDTGQASLRVRSLTPELAKGLEFDLVVLIDPESFGEGIEGAVDRYVAMTRATQQLVILTSGHQREQL